MLIMIQDNDFNNFSLTNINNITSYTQAVNKNQVVTKSSVDQFHQENERYTGDLGLNFYNESNDLVRNNQENNFNDSELTSLDSTTVNRKPSSYNGLSNQKYVDGEINKKLLSDLIKQYETISKSPLETMILHLLKILKFELQIQNLSKIPKQEDIFCRNGL